MAWSLLASAVAGSPDQGTVTTGAINTTGADLLVVIEQWYNHGQTEVVLLSDSVTNTWTHQTEYKSANRSVRISWVHAPSTSTTHTFTSAVNGQPSDYGTIEVLAFSGSATVPFDAENGTASDAAVSLATGSVTPATLDLFVTACSAGNAAAVPTVTSGWTDVDEFAFNGNHVAGGSAWKTSSSAENPTWNITNSDELAVALAAFKGAVAQANIPYQPLYGLAPTLAQ